MRQRIGIFTLIAGVAIGIVGTGITAHAGDFLGKAGGEPAKNLLATVLR